MLKMGGAKVDATPDHPVLLGGYGARNQYSDRVEDPLEIGVIALEQDDQKILWITVDMAGIFVETCAELCRYLSGRSNIPEANIFISASHTHFAPELDMNIVSKAGGKLPIGAHPRQQRYYDFWLKQLESAVASALDDLEEVSLQSCGLEISSVAFNRRTVRRADGMVFTNYIYPEDAEEYDFAPIDNELAVWKFVKDGRPKAILGRFGCHAVTGGESLYGISADFPGAFKRAIAQKFNCPGYFILGTEGDVVPMRRGGSSRQDIGEILSSSIRLNELRFVTENSPVLKSESYTIKCHLKKLDGYDRASGEERWQKVLADPASDAAKLYEEGILYRTGKRYLDNDPELPVKFLQLGKTVFIALPFEILTSLGFKLREACPQARFVSITNGYEEYLPLAEELALGGYEAEIGSYFAADTGDRILDFCIDKLKDFQ